MKESFKVTRPPCRPFPWQVALVPPQTRDFGYRAMGQGVLCPNRRNLAEFDT